MFNEANFTEGFGSSTVQELEALRKALTVDHTYTAAPGTFTGAGALQVESLDASLKSVTFTNKNLTIWPRIPKDKAYSTVEQYVRQTSYGESQNGGFFDSEAGVAPHTEDPTWNRQYQLVRYVGTTRSVAHVATLVKQIGAPMIAKAVEAGTKWILQQMERQLWLANSYFVGVDGIFDGATADIPATSLKFNGLDQQIRAGDSDAKAKYTGFEGYDDDISVVVDMLGSIPDEDALEEASRIVASNFGIPTALFMDYKAHSDISRTFYPKEWYPRPGMMQGGQGGFVLSKFISSAGIYDLIGTRFLSPRRSVLAAAESDAPNTPVVTGTAAVADVASNLDAGTYYFRASAIGQFGESLACAETVGQVIAANQHATVTIAPGIVGAQYYALFRTETSGASWLFIGFVADSTGNGGGATFVDAGNYLPGSSKAYLLQLESAEIVWRQLAPLMKMDLAVISPAYRWMQLLYGTPIVFAPRHHVILDNIGQGVAITAP